MNAPKMNNKIRYVEEIFVKQARQDPAQDPNRTSRRDHYMDILGVAGSKQAGSKIHMQIKKHHKDCH